MKNPVGVIHRWTVFLGLCALGLIVGIVVVRHPELGDSSLAGPLTAAWGIGATLLAVSVICSLRGFYTTAWILPIVGAALAFPLGLVFLLPAFRLRSAARALPKEMPTSKRAGDESMTSIICPKCGTVNVIGSMNCRTCRINLKFALEYRDEVEVAKHEHRKDGH